MNDFISMTILYQKHHNEVVEALANLKQSLEDRLDRLALDQNHPPGWAEAWIDFRSNENEDPALSKLIPHLPVWAQQQYDLLSKVTWFLQLSKEALSESQKQYHESFHRGIERGLYIARKHVREFGKLI